MGTNNKKYLFRQPALDPETDTVETLPHDIIDWFNPNVESSRSLKGGSISITIGGDSQSGGGHDNVLDTGPVTPRDPQYMPQPPGLTAKQPEILSVVKQAVRHDPQGTAYVSVTFSIGPEDSDVEYELRISKQ